MLKLLESGAKRKRSKAGLATSFAVHGALVALAIGMGSHMAVSSAEPLKAENIEFVTPPPPPPPKVEKVYVAPEPPKVAPRPAPRRAAPRPPAPRPPAPVAAPIAVVPAPINAPILQAPVSVPTSLPAIDPNAIATVSDQVARASDIAGTSKGTADQGVTTASAGDVAVGESKSDGTAWGEEQVDVAVRMQGAANLRYPERLRSANIDGTVMMRFVVGANGRVEMGSVQVIDSPHDEFTDAVKDALGRMRFRAAEVRGTKVRQLVEQSFTFRLG